MAPLWPHQEQGVRDVLAAIETGHRRICLSAPTGGGKTRIMCELIDHWVSQGLKVALYTNRRLLVEQTARVLKEHGIDYGVRAAGSREEERFAPVQICSVQTEDSRVFKLLEWGLHTAERIIVDEAHVQTGNVIQAILAAHLEEGAAIVGFTATPIGIGNLYQHLIQAGTTSQLRACGALVWCDHYGPDEPDLRKFQRLRAGEDLTENQAREVMMRPGIWGRVWEWFCKLNPEQRPTILFAPGVRESLWFAEQFSAKGVPAAHIDGQEVWADGKLTRTSRHAREDVLGRSRDGDIRVLCNRFVLREGVDAPWLAHAIFGTVFGSLQTYLQSGGRLLRRHPGVDKVSVQDHGAAWWRHGSLNADRAWSLDQPAHVVSGLREERLRSKEEAEPFLCPQCGLVLNRPVCRLCGHEIGTGKKSRPVVSTDGKLVQLQGDIYRPRRICQAPGAVEAWVRMYHRSRTKKGERTFAQAFALFAQENNWGWPDPSWPFMPLDPLDRWRKVADVPQEKLTHA